MTKLNATGTALVYSTYLGGSGYDIGNAIALDSSGSAYVTGQTDSGDFPIKNAYQPTARSLNAFVSKLSPDGTGLAYSTHLGEFGGGGGIAVDSSANAYVTGTAGTLPIKDAPQPTYGGGGSDAFVTELSADGMSLGYSTFLGGSGSDVGAGIAVDSAGAAYVAGYTNSTDFPTKNALQGTYGNGGYDAFVTKLAAGATAPAAPSVVTGAASSVSTTGATVAGTVNPKGLATSFRFEYGTSTSYGSQTADASAGSDSIDHAQSAALSGLAPGTTYHFRILATNSVGTSVGADQVFTTATPPPPSCQQTQSCPPPPSCQQTQSCPPPPSCQQTQSCPPPPSCQQTQSCPPPPSCQQTQSCPPPPSCQQTQSCPPPPPAAASVRISSASVLVSSHGTTSVTLACSSGSGRCAGTLALSVRVRVRVRHSHRTRLQTITLAKAPYSFAPGHSAQITLRLTSTGRRLLAHAQRHRLRVSATASQAHRQITLTGR